MSQCHLTVSLASRRTRLPIGATEINNRADESRSLQIQDFLRLVDIGDDTEGSRLERLLQSVLARCSSFWTISPAGFGWDEAGLIGIGLVIRQ